MINRCGFNSDGLKAVQQRLKKRETSPRVGRPGLLGINVGKNKLQEVDFKLQERGLPSSFFCGGCGRCFLWYVVGALYIPFTVDTYQTWKIPSCERCLCFRGARGRLFFGI